MDIIRKNFKQIVFYTLLFLTILTFCLIAGGYDYDLWARLIVGKHFWQTGHILKQDFLSYTPTHTWYDHEWGSSVIFYFIQNHFGEFGLLLLQSILIFLIFFVITKIVELRGVKTTTPYNFLFYFFSFSAISYLLQSIIRCQLFSFLFFAIFIYILELSRKGFSRPLVIIPFIMVVWNNLHGGCVAGLGLILLYIIGEFLNKKPIKKYIYLFIATILVLPINPWGFQYIKFLFEANIMKRPEVIEWWGLFCPYNLYKYITFKIFTLILLIAEFYFLVKGVINKNFNFDKTKFLILATTLFLAIKHVKLIPLFIISAGCFLYDDFYTFFNYITLNIFNKIAIFKDMIIYLVIVVFILSNINLKRVDKFVGFDKYPVLSVEFIKINNLKGNILTNFGLGSYVGYKLYPNNKIFMDGRYEEVYYDFMMPLLKNFHLLNKGWDELLNKYPPDLMIIEKYYPVYQKLIKDKQWSLIFDKDKIFGVFIRTKNLKKNYKQPTTDIKYYKKTIFDSNINFVIQSKHD